MVSAGTWRWATVPAAGAVVFGGVAINALSAHASSALPPRTAAQLLVDVQNAKVAGMSGTVVENADLGLPALPSVGGGSGASDLTSLISGSHTLRVWYSGEDKARVALLGTLGESDVIRSGDGVWLWASRSNTATHLSLPAGTGRHPGAGPDGTDLSSHAPLTPAQAADRAVAAITPTTEVTTDGTVSVAGRSAYELSLAPKDTASLIGSVRIAIDGKTHVPLRVRVFAASAGKPAFEVGFTHVSFATPGAEQFTFRPPPGAKVKQEQPARPGRDAKAAQQRDRAGHDAATKSGGPTVVGSGWTQVVVMDGVTAPKAGPGDGQLAAVLRSLPRVSGAWGSGALLRSSLFSVLLTDDGRLIAGPVAPERLYAAAAHR